MTSYDCLSPLQKMLRNEAMLKESSSTKLSLAETSDSDSLNSNSLYTDDTQWNAIASPPASPTKNKNKVSFNLESLPSVSQLQERLEVRFESSMNETPLRPSSNSSFEPLSPSTPSAFRTPRYASQETPDNGYAPSSDEKSCVESSCCDSSICSLTDSSPSLSSVSSKFRVKRLKRNFKNYVLLLQPQTKSFELIQIKYKVGQATVGDLVDMIPRRAIVSSLANQEYLGFARLKDGAKFCNLNLKAAGSESANIEHKEVLVALVKGFSVEQLVQYSKPILKVAMPDKGKHSRSRRRAQSSESNSIISEETYDNSMSSKSATSYSYIKNFVLLLRPSERAFELVELRHEADQTTVGDLINMIPERATVLRLGSQPYRGFVRPEDEMKMTDLSANCSNILNNEVLVAINKGNTAQEVLQFSKPILNSPNILKLLKKFDPQQQPRDLLNPTSRYLQRVPECEETNAPLPNVEHFSAAFEPSKDVGVDEPSLHASNIASIYENERFSVNDKEVVPPLIRADSPTPSTSYADIASQSYISESSHHTPRRGRRRITRRDRARRNAAMFKIAFVAFAWLVLRYFTDSGVPVVAGESAFGWTGLAQTLGVFTALTLIQRETMKDRQQTSRELSR